MAHKITSNNGIGFITKHELLRLKPYRDSSGRWTIGYGHLIKDGETFTTINLDRAQQLLEDDLRIAEAAVNRLVKIHLTQPQFNALVSLVFNIGEGAFRDSRMLEELNDKVNLMHVAQEFMVWIHSAGAPSKGLMRRRLDEAKLFLSD